MSFSRTEALGVGRLWGGWVVCAGCWASARKREPLLLRRSTLDWFYSPRKKPALLSSQRQPPRGKSTLLRPSRLPSLGLEPAPASDPRECCLASWTGLLERRVPGAGALRESLGNGERPRLGVGLLGSY